MVRLSTTSRAAAPAAAPADARQDLQDVADLKVAELRQRLAKLQQPTGGRKAELQQRLAARLHEDEEDQDQDAEEEEEDRQERDGKENGAVAAPSPSKAMATVMTAAVARSPMGVSSGNEVVSTAPATKPRAVRPVLPASAEPRPRPPVPLFPRTPVVEPVPAPTATATVAATVAVCVSRGQTACERDDGAEDDLVLADELVAEEDDASAGAAGVDDDTAERLQAMEDAMEETLADVEILDKKLAAANSRGRRLENELCRSKEEAAQVWGASQELRKRAQECVVKLGAERQAREAAERLLEEYRAEVTAAVAAVQPSHERAMLKRGAGALLTAGVSMAAAWMMAAEIRVAASGWSRLLMSLLDML